MTAVADLPTGTVTMLFSDIEGSTLLLERLDLLFDDPPPRDQGRHVVARLGLRVPRVADLLVEDRQRLGVRHRLPRLERRSPDQGDQLLPHGHVRNS